MQASILAFITFYYNIYVFDSRWVVTATWFPGSWTPPQDWAPRMGCCWILLFRPWDYHGHPAPALHPTHPTPTLPHACRLRGSFSISQIPCALVNILYVPLWGMGRQSWSVSRGEKKSRTCVHPRSEDGGLRRWRGKVGVWTVSSSCSVPGWHLSPPLPTGYGDGVARPGMTNRITGPQSWRLVMSHLGIQPDHSLTQLSHYLTSHV